MVHALERARRHLGPNGVLVLIQPRRAMRPFIALTAPGQRQAVGSLINPIFEPIITAAEAAVHNVLDRQLVVPIGKTNQTYRVTLANPSQLDAYLHTNTTPPRFPPGGRRRFLDLWSSRPPGARIQVTEFMTVMAFRIAP